MSVKGSPLHVTQKFRLIYKVSFLTYASMVIDSREKKKDIPRTTWYILTFYLKMTWYHCSHFIRQRN